MGHDFLLFFQTGDSITFPTNHFFFLKESSFTSLCTKLGTLYFLQPDFCLPDQTETRKLLGILPSMSGNARWSLQTPCTSPPPPHCYSNCLVVCVNLFSNCLLMPSRVVPSSKFRSTVLIGMSA